MVILLSGLFPSFFLLLETVLFLTKSISLILLIFCTTIASSTTNLLITRSSVRDFPLNSRLPSPEARGGAAAKSLSGGGGGAGLCRFGAAVEEKIGAHRQALVNVDAPSLREDDFLSFLLVGSPEMGGSPAAISIALWYHGFLQTREFSVNFGREE